MCSTCKYVENMPKMIQVRNVPDSLHRKLKSLGVAPARATEDEEDDA